MIIHGLILAAGESKRLGQPKQLVPYKGQPLLSRTIEHLAHLLPQVHVVLGANHVQILNNTDIKSSIAHTHVNLIHNNQWHQGMGQSLAFGIKSLPPCDAVLIALCDQALIPKSHYQQLIKRIDQFPNDIIATKHKITGVPAAFPKTYFSQLKQLKNNQGAKQIIQTHDVKRITCQSAGFDLDTALDLNALAEFERFT